MVSLKVSFSAVLTILSKFQYHSSLHPLLRLILYQIHCEGHDFEPQDIPPKWGCQSWKFLIFFGGGGFSSNDAGQKTFSTLCISLFFSCLVKQQNAFLSFSIIQGLDSLSCRSICVEMRRAPFVHCSSSETQLVALEWPDVAYWGAGDPTMLLIQWSQGRVNIDFDSSCPGGPLYGERYRGDGRYVFTSKEVFFISFKVVQDSFYKTFLEWPKIAHLAWPNILPSHV